MSGIQAVMVEKDSGRNMMSGFHGLFSVGGIVGAGGVSALLQLGWTPLQATFAMSALMIAALVTSLSGLLAYGNREETEGPALVWAKGIVLFIGLLCFIVFLGEGAVLDWSSLFLIEAHGAAPTYAGLGYASFAVAMAVGRLTGDRLVGALGGTRILALGGIVSAIGFALAVSSPALPIALLGFLLVGLGSSNIVPVLFTAAGSQKRMPASLAVAALTTIGYAGVLLGPVAIGGNAQATSLGSALLMIATGFALVAVLAPLAVDSSPCRKTPATPSGMENGTIRPAPRIHTL